MNSINIKLTKEQFKQIRTELQYTQKEMSELLGITIRAISYYESGQRPVSKTVSILMKRIYVDEQ
jgi:transcriptional regulator with XRE-family HTH domain